MSGGPRETFNDELETENISDALPAEAQTFSPATRQARASSLRAEVVDQYPRGTDEAHELVTAGAAVDEPGPSGVPPDSETPAADVSGSPAAGQAWTSAARVATRSPRNEVATTSTRHLGQASSPVTRQDAAQVPLRRVDGSGVDIGPRQEALHQRNTAREVLWPQVVSATALPPRPIPPRRGAMAWRAQRHWPALENAALNRGQGPALHRPTWEVDVFREPADAPEIAATTEDRPPLDQVFAERLVRTLEELFNWHQQDDRDSEASMEDESPAGGDIFALREVALPETETSGMGVLQWSNLLDIYLSDVRASRAIMDTQGIPWGSDTSARSVHHHQRIREYPNYMNVADSMVAARCDTRDTRALQAYVLGGYGQVRCHRSRSDVHSLQRWLHAGAPCVPPRSTNERAARSWSKKEDVSTCRAERAFLAPGSPRLPFYSMVECTRRVRPSVVHFQLRHLLRATSEDDVYLVQNNCLLHYCPSLHQVRCLLNLSGQTVYWNTSRMLGLSTTALSRSFRERPPTWYQGRRLSGRWLTRASESDWRVRTDRDAGDAQDSPIDPETDAEHRALSPADLGRSEQAESPLEFYRTPPYRNDGRRVQVSTMASDGRLCVAGGFSGEIIAVDAQTGAVQFDWRVARNTENAITNYIELFYRTEAKEPGSLGRARRMATAHNDCFVRLFDLERCGCGSGEDAPPADALLKEVPFPWPVNHVTVQPTGSWRHPEPGSLLAIAGDHTEVWLVHHESGACVQKLKGHRDYAFATAWHPNGIQLATGNQDGTFRIWDVRQTSAPLRCVFPARLGAVRSLQYSDDGRFLCVAEVADWVHIVDAFGGSRETSEADSLVDASEARLSGSLYGYVWETVLDIFGEIAGVSFSPMRAEYLFVGISDPTYGCLMQYRRHREAYSLSRWIGA